MVDGNIHIIKFVVLVDSSFALSSSVFSFLSPLAEAKRIGKSLCRFRADEKKSKKA